MRTSHPGGACETNKPSTPIVQSAARAIRILRLLWDDLDGLTLSDLSRKLGLHKVTVLRLMRTLVAEGIVTRRPYSKRYHLDLSLWIRTASAFNRILSRTAIAQTLLQDLASATGATTMLAFPDDTGRKLVISMWALSQLPLRYDPSADRLTPMMHESAVGKCILAQLSEDKLRAWLEQGLPKITANTITSPQKMREELAVVRARGYALCHGESVPGISALGVPLKNDEGIVIGGLALAIPAIRLNSIKIQAWLPALQKTAENLSKALYNTEQL